MTSFRHARTPRKGLRCRAAEYSFRREARLEQILRFSPDRTGCARGDRYTLGVGLWAKPLPEAFAARWV